MGSALSSAAAALDSAITAAAAPPSRQEQLTDKQPRPNKKKKQWREMEEIREFCPSYEEALQLNPTDEAVSEEELRHSHCC
uniref:Uncharacterized protein n=1 Tax=Oryza rufipogon TaxID=4529 RepID=A0A0E0MRY4_ORYRU